MILDVIADIIAIYTIVVIILFLGLALIGLSALREEALKHKLLVENSERRVAEPIGMSVVVGGVVTLDELEELLSFDYLNYEVILVTDIDQLPYREVLLSRYALVEMTIPDHLDIEDVVLRRLFRSRERRYRRLVVADQPFETLAQAYNCGVCVSGHDYVVAVNRWMKINPDALRRLSAEIQDHAGEVYAVGALRGIVFPQKPLCLLDYVVKLVTVGAGIGTLSGIGTHPNTLIVFEYNAVVDAGGYRDSFLPDLELYTRVHRLADRKLVEGVSIFTPQIVARQTDSSVVCCTKTPGFAMRDKSPMTSRYTLAVVLGLAVIMLPLSALVRNWEVFRLIVYIWVAAYVGAVTVALLAMLSYRQSLVAQGYKGSVRRIVAVAMLYPAYLIKCLVSAKNFVK